MRVPGALVVMTGCAAGTGTAADGAGLQGLTRAWLTAGASNVVATLWPVEDRSGDLLPSFYRHRRDGPPAEALRRSQREAIASGTWQADAANWAAYQVSGGER
jgi:CHAT domain-containing protein